MTSQPLDPDEMPVSLATLFGSGAGRVLAGVNDDDCAVLKWGDEILVVTTDFLNSRPIVTELGLGGSRELGRLLVAANLSDLCGSGADPRALLVAVTKRRGATEQDFLDLMDGVRLEADRWGVPVVGGDTKLGDADSILGIAIGAAQSEEHLFLKRNAGPGDILWVSGELGSCSAAVAGLSRGGLGQEWEDWARRVIVEPNLPLEKSRALALSGFGRGGTDISDGLGADLQSLCEASRVGAVVEVDQLPLARETVQLGEFLSIDPWRFAFGVGGDFQFLVTSGEQTADRVASLGYHRIGRITADLTCRLHFANGEFAPLPVSGHRDAHNLPFVQEVEWLIKRSVDPTL